MTVLRVTYSPNAPRPDDPLIIEISDALYRISVNYEREGSGPGSRFEGRLLEDVQVEWIIRHIPLRDDAGPLPDHG